MALYAIGDVQGCYDSLLALLEKLRFDAAEDRLWFTGDLVNRGPKSLETLRFIINLGDLAVTVLGNHDLHLLAVAAGGARLYPHDTLGPVLSAPDRDALLAWLSTRPLLHHDHDAGCALVHAGLLPQWDMGDALARAREAEAVIRGAQAPEFFRHMYGNRPDRWSDQLEGWERLRVVVNAFTRVRFCTEDGRMDFTHDGAPGTQPRALRPWFKISRRRSRGTPIVFGHWSLLGRYADDGVICVDSGCLWGRTLSAVRLSGERREFVSVSCPVYRAPDG